MNFTFFLPFVNFFFTIKNCCEIKTRSLRSIKTMKKERERIFIFFFFEKRRFIQISEEHLLEPSEPSRDPYGVSENTTKMFDNFICFQCRFSLHAENL